VSEVAVVGYPHDIKGEGIFAFVVLKHTNKNVDEATLTKELKALCKSNIAAYAVPDFIMVGSICNWEWGLVHNFRHFVLVH
jgi:acetyl-CoA synthetase